MLNDCQKSKDINKNEYNLNNMYCDESSFDFADP